MNGVVNIQKNGYSIFFIDNFSDEIKESLRQYLSCICHGELNVESGADIYSYKNTLKEFCKRYKKKAPKQKIGQIGELLTHLMINLFLSNKFCSNSPFFNMEEDSAKKGFDVLLSEKNSSNLWYTEIKSGEKKSTETSDQKVSQLLDTACHYLKETFNENNTTLWHNAVNSARCAISDNRVEKKDIIKILQENAGHVSNQTFVLSNQNVIFVGNVFADVSAKFAEATVQNWCGAFQRKKYCNSFYLIALQKNTYQAVEQFLFDEAGV